MPTHDKRVLDRDRALARLSRLTTLTAVAGVVGTVGFGGLAALNYSGTTTNSGTSTNSTTDSGSSTTTLANDPTVQATAAPNGQLQPAQPPRRSSRRSRVSTGGSG